MNEAATLTPQQKQVFKGKKILIISEDQNVIDMIQQTAKPRGGSLFIAKTPKDAITQTMTKNPDLLVYDDRMPLYQNLKVLFHIKRFKPNKRILLLTEHEKPMRSIDDTGLGASMTLPYYSSEKQYYNALKHSLGITSVPRVEEQE